MEDRFDTPLTEGNSVGSAQGTNTGGMDALRGAEIGVKDEVAQLDKALLRLGVLFGVASPLPPQTVDLAKPASRLSCSALDEVSQRLHDTAAQVAEMTNTVQSWASRLA